MYSIRRILLLVLMIIPVTSLHAQDTTILTIALPMFYQETLQDALDTFEELNPTIQVEVVEAQFPDYHPGDDDIEAYLDSMADFASAADVLVGTGQFSPLTTRAGYFLDLNPLVQADPTFDTDGFFAPMWGSFQWEGGLWAIPLAGDVIGMLYDPADFDAAGLRYPDERWTFEDLQITAEQLAVVNDDGSLVESPILNLTESGYLLMAALGKPLYDPFALEVAPAFDDVQLEALMESWQDLVEEGYVGVPSEDFNLTTLAFGQSILAAVTGFIDENREYQYSTLPGGSIALLPLGAGISIGSQHREEAYELIKYLTMDPVAYGGLIGQPIPARSELFGTEQKFGFFTFQVPEELQDTVLSHADSAIPYAELLFSQYVTQAVDDFVRDGIEARDALNAAEEMVLDDLIAARDRQGTEIIVRSVDQVEVGAGEAELTFGIVSFGFQIPNRDAWNAVASDFVTNNDGIGHVELERISQFGGNVRVADFVDTVDCFYQPTRIDPQQDGAYLLPLDPLIATDVTIENADFVGNVFATVKANNQTYGIPLHIQPEVMFYSEEIFDRNGAFLPYAGWGVADFEQTLRDLRYNTDDPPPYSPRGIGGTYLLTLIAVYGGLPLDYRQEPVGIDFASESNVAAIRQVLDLAKDGLIDYQPLGRGLIFGGLSVQDNPAIYSQILGDIFDFGDDDESAAQYQPINFPQGNTFSAISYDVGAAYISANSNHAESCYAFISELAQHPELFGSMPAMRSLLTEESFQQAQSTEAIEFFEEIDKLLQQPNVIEFPSLVSQIGQIGDVIVTFWLFEAFDAYVLEEADLESALTDAQQYALDYQACTATIAPFVSGEDDPQSYITQFAQCSVDVDPDTRNRFPGFDLQ